MVRAKARAKVPADKRKEISAKACKAVRNRKPAYSMDAERAAEVLGVSRERIDILVADGLIGHRWRNGSLWVSSQDVATLIAQQERNRRRCSGDLSAIARASAKRTLHSLGLSKHLEDLK